MAITVYTYNDKVLKNVATDKWLKKPAAPAGFVMNASNASIQGYFIYWQGPDYPNGYDGDGKSYTIVNNNSGSVGPNSGLMYLGSSITGGPTAIPQEDIVTGSGTLTANSATAASGFGMHLGMALTKGGAAPTEEEVLDYLANLTITILD